MPMDYQKSMSNAKYLPCTNIAGKINWPPKYPLPVLFAFYLPTPSTSNVCYSWPFFPCSSLNFFVPKLPSVFFKGLRVDSPGIVYNGAPWLRDYANKFPHKFPRVSRVGLDGEGLSTVEKRDRPTRRLNRWYKF